MKILTKKKQDELMKILTAVTIIGVETEMDIRLYDRFLELVAILALAIGGVDGLEKVQKSTENFYKPKAGEHHE